MPTPQNIFLKSVADLALNIGQKYVADRNNYITLHHLFAKGSRRNGNEDVYVDYELTDKVVVVRYIPKETELAGYDQVTRGLQAIFSFDKLPVNLQELIVKPQLQNRMLKEDYVTWNNKKMTISEILIDPAEASVTFVLKNMG